jgi:hypothetical protein
VRAAGEVGVLWTLFAILLALWLVGFCTGMMLGGLVHLLLVVALTTLSGLSPRGAAKRTSPSWKSHLETVVRPKRPALVWRKHVSRAITVLPSKARTSGAPEIRRPA